MKRLFFLFPFICFVDQYSTEYVPSKAAGEPLILTPLLQAGKIAEARNKSEVEPLLPNVFSHSGYFTVNQIHNSNLFFWFFKQTSPHWITKPVILWLQGGPGCSSIFGLFTENGPFSVVNGTLKRRKYSWTNDFNVLFIDQPIGTGFSFTDDYYVTTQQEVGRHLYIALIQFFQLFPELRTNEFFISGESYAGKYIPALAYEIYKRNPSADHIVNLKGLLIGNGLVEKENMNKFAVHIHRLGIIDFRQKRIRQLNEERTRITIRNSSWSNAEDSFYHTVFPNLRKFTKFYGIYDFTDDNFDDNEYIAFMENDNFRKIIHVGNATYDDCSSPVYDGLSEDIMKSVKPLVEKLLTVYPIMLYSGQLDIIVAHYLTSDLIEQLHWPGAEGFSQTSRRKWYVQGRLAGYYKSYGNLTQALIRNAGHMVPTKQPLHMLDLLHKFVYGVL